MNITIHEEDIEWYVTTFHFYAGIYPLDEPILAGRKIIIGGLDIEGIPHEELTTLRSIALFLDERKIQYERPHNEITEESLHPNGHLINLSTYFG